MRDSELSLLKDALTLLFYYNKTGETEEAIDQAIMSGRDYTFNGRSLFVYLSVLATYSPLYRKFYLKLAKSQSADYKNFLRTVKGKPTLIQNFLHRCFWQGQAEYTKLWQNTRVGGVFNPEDMDHLERVERMPAGIAKDEALTKLLTKTITKALAVDIDSEDTISEEKELTPEQLKNIAELEEGIKALEDEIKGRRMGGVTSPKLEKELESMKKGLLEYKGLKDEKKEEPKVVLPNLPQTKTPGFVKDLASKGQILARKAILKFATPTVIAHAVSGAIGAAIGAGAGPSGALLGGGVGLAAPTLITKFGMGGAILGGAQGALGSGIGQKALMFTPPGRALMVAQLASKKIKLILKIAIPTVIALILVLFFGLNVNDNNILVQGGVGQASFSGGSNSGGSLVGGSCPDQATININKRSPESCKYFNPGIDIFADLSQSQIDSFIDKYYKTFGDKAEFTRRTNYIVSKARQVKLNPIIFLGYWETESKFSTFPGAADLGCDPTNPDMKGFETQVDCATGIRSDGAWISKCASPINPDRMKWCERLKGTRDAHPNIYSSIPPPKYPISTFDDFAETYGSRSLNLNCEDEPPTTSCKNTARINYNCTHTYNELIEVAEGANACQASTPTTPGSTPGNFVYYCQGNPKYDSTKDAGIANNASCPLGNVGCAPTSFAMILSSFGISTNPDDMAKVFNQNSWWYQENSCSLNSNASAFSTSHINWLRSKGFTVYTTNLVDKNGNFDIDTAANLTSKENGYLILASANSYPIVKFASAQTQFGGHVFVIDKVDKQNGTVEVRDPNNCTYTDNTEFADNRTRVAQTLCPVDGTVKLNGSVETNCQGRNPLWFYAYAIKK